MKTLSIEDLEEEGYGYLDSDGSALCRHCAEESLNEDELPNFKPVSKFMPNSEDICDQCGEVIE